MFKLSCAIARSQSLLFDNFDGRWKVLPVEGLHARRLIRLQICLQTNWNRLNLASFSLIVWKQTMRDGFSVQSAELQFRYMQLRKPIWRYYHTRFSSQPGKMILPEWQDHFCPNWLIPRIDEYIHNSIICNHFCNFFMHNSFFMHDMTRSHTLRDIY